MAAQHACFQPIEVITVQDKNEKPFFKSCGEVEFAKIPAEIGGKEQLIKLTLTDAVSVRCWCEARR